jgi:hypothetical protein
MEPVLFKPIFWYTSHMDKSFELRDRSYLDIFHLAQSRLLEGDIEDGKKLLNQAAELVGVIKDEHDFLEYIKGTLAYLEKDENLLRGAINSIKDPVNKGILKRFLTRLESGEEVDYNKDYKNL